MNYQCGFLKETTSTFPLNFELGSHYSLCIRTVIGLAVVAATEFIGKGLIYSIICLVLKEDKKKLKELPNSVDNAKKNCIELTTKFLTYSILGFNTLFVVPLIFDYFHVQRDSFYTEI